MKTDEIQLIKKQLKNNKHEIMQKTKKVELGLIALHSSRKPHGSNEEKIK